MGSSGELSTLTRQNMCQGKAAPELRRQLLVFLAQWVLIMVVASGSIEEEPLKLQREILESDTGLRAEEGTK